MRAAIAIALAVGLAAVAVGPARADHDDHGRGRRWGHEHHDRGWHGHGQDRHYFHPWAPDVYYAPPPIVYAPAYPSPGINFVFPLRIR